MASKKKQRRRAKAKRRAPNVRDVKELLQLASERPVAAARAFEHFARQRGDRPEELHEVGAAVAAALRKAGRAQLALELLEPLAGATQRLLLEEALAAYSLGHFDRVREIAERDAILAKILHAPLAAQSGAKVGTTPAKSVTALRALYCWCRAVEKAAVGNAKSGLRSLSRASKGEGVNVGLLDSALHLLDEGSMRAFVALTEDCDDVQTLQLAATAYARWDPARRLAALDPQAERERSASMALATSKVPLTPGECARLALEHLGPSAFTDVGTASLHAGFDALVELDVEAARGHFAEAMGQGADMGECVRGLWLTERVHCMSSHPSQSDVNALSKAASAYERFLARDPHSRAVYAAFLLDCTEACALTPRWTSAGQGFHRRLHELVGDSWLATPALLAVVALAGAGVHAALGDHAEALTILEAALEVDPEDPTLLALARHTARELPDQTRATHFEHRLKALEGEVISAGALLCRLRETFAMQEPVDPEQAMRPLLRTADALDPEARLAFDAAALGLSTNDAQRAQLARYLRDRLAGTPAPRSVYVLLTMAGHFGFRAELEVQFERFLKLPIMASTLENVLVALAQQPDGHQPARLLAILGRDSSRTKLRALQRRVTEQPTGEPFEDIVSSLDQHTHPEFCCDAFVFGGAEHGPISPGGDSADWLDDFGVPAFMRDEALDMLKEQARAAGLPPDMLEALLSGQLGPLDELLPALGGFPDPGSSLGPRKKNKPKGKSR